MAHSKKDRVREKNRLGSAEARRRHTLLRKVARIRQSSPLRHDLRSIRSNFRTEESPDALRYIKLHNLERWVNQ